MQCLAYLATHPPLPPPPLRRASPRGPHPMAATATTVMNTITDTEEKALEALVTVHAPVVEYVAKAVDYVETSIPSLPTQRFGESLPTIKQFVDNQFAFAGKVLD